MFDPSRILDYVKARACGRRPLSDARPPWRDDRPPTHLLRIQLGCGRDCWPGYVNVDVDPGTPADVHAHFLPYLESLGDGAADEIAMIHSLSYLRLAEARRLFAQAHRVLQPAGVFIVELPDLAKCARNLLKARGDLDEYLRPIMGIYAFDVDMIRNDTSYVPYAFGWSAWHLTRELQQAGFRDVRTRLPQSSAHDRTGRRDSRVEATKAPD